MRPGYAYTDMCQKMLKAAIPQAQPCFPKVTCTFLTQQEYRCLHTRNNPQQIQHITIYSQHAAPKLLSVCPIL